MNEDAQNAFGERGPQGDHGQHGDTGPTGPQGEPGKNWRFTSGSLLRLLAYLAVAGACIFASARTFDLASENTKTLEKIEQEGVERRDQSCTIAEREHLRAVESLRSTYLYVVNLPEEELSSTLNRTIISQIPQTEERAKTDVAPPFCDEPGQVEEERYKRTQGEFGSPPVGLPEPDPEIPERPDKVNELIKQVASDAKANK
jgi:hypothetical protein